MTFIIQGGKYAKQEISINNAHIITAWTSVSCMWRRYVVYARARAAGSPTAGGN
jgi:hypothetical protein